MEEGIERTKEKNQERKPVRNQKEILKEILKKTGCTREQARERERASVRTHEQDKQIHTYAPNHAEGKQEGRYTSDCRRAHVAEKPRGKKSCSLHNMFYI